MDKRLIFDFLRELSANNSKEWMDANRDRYHEAKDIWLAEIQLILDRLSEHDPAFALLMPKQLISRINNNRRFHQDRPIYKDYFTCMPRGGASKPAFYLSVGPNESFIGGGFHRPDKEVLANLRQAIDTDGEELLRITTEQDFVSVFGGLDRDETQLKTSPKGYPADHPHIALLRRKNFTARIPLHEDEVVSDEFVDRVEQAYVSIRPFLDFMEEAVLSRV